MILKILPLPRFYGFVAIILAMHYLDVVPQKTDLQIVYWWRYINFTWPSGAAYQEAVNSRSYILENVGILGTIKYYNGQFYFALPRIRDGVPVTLATFSEDEPNGGPLFTPYPSWNLNVKKSCRTLQSVLSVEISPNGIMWVVDGVRAYNKTACPPKLVLLDLNNNGRILHSYTFTKDVALPQGAFLNDIVLDIGPDGDEFAFITDNSLIDPGLIVYSKKVDSAWKLRDVSVFAEPGKAGFVVNGLTFNQLSPINGIALSPIINKNTGERIIYYSALTGVKLHSLSSLVAKNYSAYETGDWRKFPKLVGHKKTQGDGMAMDNQGNLYFGLLPLYGIGLWNMKNPLSSAQVFAQNSSTMIWVDAFGFDQKGNVYMQADNGNSFLDTSLKLTVNVTGNWTIEAIRFRIFKWHTGTKSYLYG